MILAFVFCVFYALYIYVNDYHPNDDYVKLLKIFVRVNSIYGCRLKKMNRVPPTTRGLCEYMLCVVTMMIIMMMTKE